MNEQNPSSDIRRKMQKPYVIDIGRKRQTIGLNQISQGKKRKKKKRKNKGQTFLKMACDEILICISKSQESRIQHWYQWRNNHRLFSKV